MLAGKGGGLVKVGGVNLSTSGSSGPFCAALPNVIGRLFKYWWFGFCKCEVWPENVAESDFKILCLK